MAQDCHVDVYGWAEPGTNIKVNGQSAPLAPDGLFLQETSPSREGTIARLTVGDGEPSHAGRGLAPARQVDAAEHAGRAG
jgi:hypothetical protein